MISRLELAEKVKRISPLSFSHITCILIRKKIPFIREVLPGDILNHRIPAKIKQNSVGDVITEANLINRPKKKQYSYYPTLFKLIPFFLFFLFISPPSIKSLARVEPNERKKFCNLYTTLKIHNRFPIFIYVFWNSKAMHKLNWKVKHFKSF